MNVLTQYRQWKQARQKAELQSMRAELLEMREGFGRLLEKRGVPDEVRVMTNEMYRVCGEVEEMMASAEAQS